jgi:hypothetical protein
MITKCRTPASEAGLACRSRASATYSTCSHPTPHVAQTLLVSGRHQAPSAHAPPGPRLTHLLSATFSPLFVHTGDVSWSLARSCLTASTRAPVHMDPMLSMSTSPLDSLSTWVGGGSDGCGSKSRNRNSKSRASEQSGVAVCRDVAISRHPHDGRDVPFHWLTPPQTLALHCMPCSSEASLAAPPVGTPFHPPCMPPPPPPPHTHTPCSASLPLYSSHPAGGAAGKS